MHRKVLFTLTAMVLASSAWSANDAEMTKLAGSSGCLTCHAIESGAKGPDGMAPIGPPWRDVAAKYKGHKGAAQTLTHVVMTGSSPYDSHWKGKISGLSMPPNAVAIKEADAKKLIGWILALEPTAKK